MQSESLKSVFYMHLSSLCATVLHLNFMQEQRHMRTSLTASHTYVRSILAMTHKSLVSGHNVPHNKLLLIKPAESQKLHCVPLCSVSVVAVRVTVHSKEIWN